MAAAASERVTREGFVSLACPGCGSALDKTANTVDKVCQTIYCNEECLQRDAKSHALWCKKTTEAMCSADTALTAINIKASFQRYINEKSNQLSIERNVGLIGSICNGKNIILGPQREGDGSIFKPNVFAAEMPKNEKEPFPGLTERIKDLTRRFPLPLHLVVLSMREVSYASIHHGQLHLFRLNHPVGKVEEKKGS